MVRGRKWAGQSERLGTIARFSWYQAIGISLTSPRPLPPVKNREARIKRGSKRDFVTSLQRQGSIWNGEMLTRFLFLFAVALCRGEYLITGWVSFVHVSAIRESVRTDAV